MRQELIERAVEDWRATGWFRVNGLTMQELRYIQGVRQDEMDEETGHQMVLARKSMRKHRTALRKLALDW
jgi:hypothetical protein